MTTARYDQLTERLKQTKENITQDQRHALNRMELEMIHYRNTGIGKLFLIQAVENLLVSLRLPEHNRE